MSRLQFTWVRGTYIVLLWIAMTQCATSAWAQDPPRAGSSLETQTAPMTVSVDSFGLPEAVIVASRGLTPLQSVGHTFDVITGSELAALPISSAAEALQYVIGLDLRQRGPRGVQADLSIRGGTFDQALVLVNGIKLADPQTGHHLLNIPVPLENIERIEVLKGPGARLYGQNAFAGAINIVTRVDAEAGATLAGEVGENGLAGFGVSLSVPTKRVRQTLSLRRDLAQGYRENTDYTVQNLMYQAVLAGTRSEWGLLAALSEREFGANGFYASATATQQYEEIQTSVVALTHERGGLSQRLSWRRNQDEYVFLRRNPSVYRNLHISHVVGYDAYKRYTNRWGHFGLAGELQHINLRSNLLGNRERQTVNLVAEQQFDLLGERLMVTPGITFNYLSDAGSRVLPGVDALLELTDRTSVYGNVGMTYRVPTYTDLYYRDRFNEGNPSLTAERALAYELGLKYREEGLEGRVAVWQREAMDLIDYLRDNAQDTVWQPFNITDVTFRGIETQLVARRLTSWLPVARLSYAYIDAQQEQAEGETISRYALEQLRHQATAQATFRLGERLSTTATVRYADRDSDATTTGVPVDYTLVDLRLDYRLKSFNAFVEATNLLDEAYAQANGVPLPGRWARAGVRVRLEK